MDVRQFTTPQAPPKSIRFTVASDLPYNAFRETPGVFCSGRRGNSFYLKPNCQQNAKSVNKNKLAVENLVSYGGFESPSRKRRRLCSPGYEITGFRTPLKQLQHGNTPYSSSSAPNRVLSASSIAQAFPSVQKATPSSEERVNELHLQFSTASRKQLRTTASTRLKRLHKEAIKQSPVTSTLAVMRQYPWLILQPKPPTPPPWLYNPREKTAFQFSGVRNENRND